MFKVTTHHEKLSDIRHGDTLIQTRVTRTAITPATARYTDLAAWVKLHATFDEDYGWELKDADIGSFDSCGSEDINDLVFEIFSWLTAGGVVFTGDQP